MTDPDFENRIERLEARFERQQETIDSQQARIENQQNRIAGLEAEENTRRTTGIDRRTALQAGGLLGLLGLGATNVGAETEVGRIGTESSPIDRLYTEELAGPLLDGAGPIDSLAGQGLRVDNASLRTGDVILTERGEPDAEELESDESMLYISDGTDSFEQDDLVYASQTGRSPSKRLGMTSVLFPSKVSVLGQHSTWRKRWQLARSGSVRRRPRPSRCRVSEPHRSLSRVSAWMAQTI